MENIKKILFVNGKLNKETDFYHNIRSDFTYHSSNIEGSILTKAEHEKIAVLNKEKDIFAIKEMFPDSDPKKQNDAIENANCIKLFDYVLESINIPISHEELKKWQGILKNQSALQKASPEQVGQYRKEDVVVTNSSFDSAPYRLVYSQMDSLIKDFEFHGVKSLEDIPEFHCRFETIHPFRDGNGRVGRMIAFKQCIENDIYLFIIDNICRNQYFDALFLYNSMNSVEYLVNLFVELQGVFKYKYSEFITQGKK